MPTASNFNVTAFLTRATPDYVATFNPNTRAITKLELLGFTEPRGLSVHGMDVVPDEHDPDLLWVYLVNHRPPLDFTADANVVGADSAIEIFKTRVGASTMEWVKTMEDPVVMFTPNDILGGANGQEFWFTNDSPIKTGDVMKALHLLFRTQSTWVGYCHVDSGCKVAVDQIHSSNGIVRNTDGTVWVASSAAAGYITVHEQQADKTLVPTEVIQVGRTLDNLALSDGFIIAAAAPKLFQFIFNSAHNPAIPSPASAYRISINTGHSSYFGEKYKVEKIFEEDGSLLGSAATSAAMHGDNLYLHEFVIHPSGILYLACTPSPWTRVAWAPAGDSLNATAFRARSDPDYVVTFNPPSKEITKLKLVNFVEPRGLSLQGMDVVPDGHDANLLWVYLVNHRPPLDPKIDAAKVGADSVIEIFKTRLGTNVLEWVKTMEDPSVIVTPNDVLGGTNGKEFWFTNDNAVKVGLKRYLHLLFRVKSTWVGYCHVDTGCKVAADELYFSNGIVRASDGTVWVASSGSGDITVHEQQADKTLAPTEVIQIGRVIDNLSLAPDGSIIAATIPNALHLISQSAKNPSIPSPASAHRISINKDQSSYFGEKYKVEKIFEEDGTMLGSAASTVVEYEGKLYLHGVIAPRLLICKLPS
ncbi:hypothetical protein FRC07_003892 [Ceratobasidium sp. 392]|nr:hypothetical protein FRC07_003892 [Ceratobasidium sp. 392]